jgi:hypothetical protein
MREVDEISTEIIAAVRGALEAFADKAQLPTYGDIEAAVGIKFRRHQWREVLDPIYEATKAVGEPDLSCIVVYGGGDLNGYPAYFSDGGEARSRPFNPNNLSQLKRWTKEVERVFASRRK